MSTSNSTEWISGWTAEQPADIGYVALGRDEGTWVSWRQGSFEIRDLGLSAVSNGAITAQHIRGTGTPFGVGPWHFYELDYEFFYVIKGSLEMEDQDGQRHQFGPGSAGYHPGYYWHREISRSGDLEVVWITSPAEGKRVDGRENPLPDRAASLPADRAPVYTHELDENYELGAGPRKFFRYRDLGMRGPTEGRMHIHIVRATEPGAGTGWHYHSMAQWFMIIGGDSWIRVEDRPAQHLQVGDTMCIGRGERMRHNVAPFSGDYAVLEMCVPAEYETISVDPPEGAAPAPEGARE
jgi:quercetin dioxygenase-like cupin family protein